MTKFALVGAALAALTLNLYAVETKFWQQTEAADFEKGSFESVSLRSDGRIFIAPSARELFDSSTPYLWAIVSDSKGNLFAGGGGGGSGKSKLFEIGRDGKTRTVAELDGLEIHAIAIDKHDHVYAATDPDGKIYKITGSGKAEVFYDPHAKYIWGMSFDREGNLFVATGDQGLIYRVTPDGKGDVFFRTEETHARSIAVDAKGNLIVGTEPGGVILRISPAAEGFVLYQTPKREITSVAVDRNGSIFAAGVGSRTAAASSETTHLIILPPAPSGTSGTSPTAAATARATGTAATAPPVTISGGSEVYRIDPDGSPHKVWSNATDIVYAIGFDSNDHPLLGSGNRGHLYRLDSDTLSTQLVTLAPTQVTSFATTPQGGIYAITGNIGKVYEIGPGFARSGRFESESLDAGSFAYWGRVALRGTGGASVSIRTRSGNVNRPVSNWSPWTAVALQANGDEWSGRIASPAARYLQYEIALAPSGTKAPDVASIEIAYLTKNVAPVVEQVEITPPNYRFPPQSLAITPSTNITLPAMGHKSTSSSSSSDSGIAVTMNYAKGYIGARWLAHDENGDTMEYRVDIRGKGENEWKLLKDKLKDKEYSWDSTAFPDGEYELRVTASDRPSNPPGQALACSLISDPFLIDNTPPQITGLTATPGRGGIDVRWRARDALTIIDHAEYSVNGGDWVVAEPVSRLSDSPEEEYRVTVPRSSNGEQTIAVRVTDYYDNQAVDKVVVK